MHYLIDAHNLIAQHPDIDLEDPNDEVKLVLAMRSWVAAQAAGRKRLVTLYFDGGLPGGRRADLSGAGIEVVFAPAGQPADNLLIRRIKKVRNPREYTLVTGDRQIIQAAQKRYMPVITAEAFAGRLVEEREKRQAAAKPAAGDDPTITADEVQEWLDLFGPVPERPTQRKRSARPQQQTRPEAQKPKPAGELKTEGALSDEDVAAWLELFGGESQKPASSRSPTAKKKKGEQKKPAGEPQNDSEGSLSDEDLATWLDWLGSE